MSLNDLSLFILSNPFVLFVTSNALLIYLSLMLVFAYTLYRSFAQIRGEFSQIKLPIWIFLLLIVLFGGYIRAANYEQYSYIDSELGEYVNTAVYLHEGKPLELSFHGKLYSFFLYLLFGIFGFKIWVVGWYNSVIGAMTSLIAFLIAYAIFKNDKGALISSLIFTTAPGPMLYSIRNGDATTGLFFLSLTLLFLFLYLKGKQPLLLVLCLSSFLAAMLTRVNYILLVPMIVFVCYLNRSSIARYSKKWIALFSLFMLLAFIPLMYTLSTNIHFMRLPVQLEKIETNGSSFARSEHIHSILNILFQTEPEDPRHWQIPRWSYLLVAFSLFCFLRYQKEITVLLIYLATMLVVYANSIVHLTPTDLPRMMVPWTLIHSIFMGMGFAALLILLNKLPRYAYFIAIAASFAAVSYMALQPISEKVLHPAHRNDPSGINMIEACHAIPRGSHLIFQNSLYNSLYFHCYEHLDGNIRNQLPQNLTSIDIREQESVFSLKKQGMRVFVASKEGLRGPEWTDFERFISLTNHSLRFQSQHIDIYEILD